MYCFIYTVIAIKSQNYIDKNYCLLFFNALRVIVSAAAANAAM